MSVSVDFGLLGVGFGKVGGVVDLGAYTADLVTDVVAIQVAAPTLGFVLIFKLFPGFTVEFVNEGWIGVGGWEIGESRKKLIMLVSWS